MKNIDRKKYIFGSLFLLANRLQVMGDQYLGRENMTTKQWLLTVMISQFQKEPPTLSQVGELMGTSRQNVKQLALKLEEKEFVKIVKDERDARALRLVLTDKCKTFWNGRQEKDDKFIEKLFEEFSQEETDTVCACFNKLFEKLDKMDIENV